MVHRKPRDPQKTSPVWDWDDCPDDHRAGGLGILYNMRNGLQAMGEKRKPLTSSFMELVGKIVFSACIIPVLGYWGVIICEPLIWCGMTVQLVYCYVHVMRDNLQKVGMET